MQGVVEIRTNDLRLGGYYWRPRANLINVHALRDQLLGVKKSRFDNDYELKEELGKGSFSTCYRCEHRHSHCEFAVKVSRPDHSLCRQVFILDDFVDV